MNTTTTTRICCPKFDPSLYTDENCNSKTKTITWQNKPFVKDGTYCFFYIPLAFGRAVTRATTKISNANAECPKEEFMILSDCQSPFYSNIYLSISKDRDVIEGAQIENISGRFLAKVFEGEYRDMWVDEMKDIVKEKREDNTAADNNDDLKMYFYYPTCPKCSKEYGKNYVVIMAKIGELEDGISN